MVVAALYVGSGARSSPIDSGENSGDGDRDIIVMQSSWTDQEIEKFLRI